uniref:Sulfatase n=1 Tax=uncultured Flavobacteriales bacterium TaxID=213322 RepID=A0A060BJ77_9FLAO|nr:sulfatase [uncultured Flavobacteriales bacterium]
MPFFCYLAFNAVHTPLEIVEHWADPFRQQGLPEVWCRLYGMLQNLDENIGKVSACLEELRLTENTIVLFTADHGPCGSASHQGESVSMPVCAGSKGQFYQGGVRVPCFLVVAVALAKSRREPAEQSR